MEGILRRHSLQYRARLLIGPIWRILSGLFLGWTVLALLLTLVIFSFSVNASTEKFNVGFCKDVFLHIERSKIGKVETFSQTTDFPNQGRFREVVGYDGNGKAGERIIRANIPYRVTADGQRFEFDVPDRYQMSMLQDASTASSKNNWMGITQRRTGRTVTWSMPTIRELNFLKRQALEIPDDVILIVGVEVQNAGELSWDSYWRRLANREVVVAVGTMEPAELFHDYLQHVPGIIHFARSHRADWLRTTDVLKRVFETIDLDFVRIGTAASNIRAIYRSKAESGDSQLNQSALQTFFDTIFDISNFIELRRDTESLPSNGPDLQQLRSLTNELENKLIEYKKHFPRS